VHQFLFMGGAIAWPACSIVRRHIRMFFERRAAALVGCMFEREKFMKVFVVGDRSARNRRLHCRMAGRVQGHL
jgi:hypothetical protein